MVIWGEVLRLSVGCWSMRVFCLFCCFELVGVIVFVLYGIVCENGCVEF